MFQSLTVLVIVAVTTQVECEHDSSSDFLTPNKRNYDQFEILERSNFDSEDSAPSAAEPIDTAKSIANAQVMLRFGGGDPRQCACGHLCQCKFVPPYYPPGRPYLPLAHPVPPFAPVHPLPPVRPLPPVVPLPPVAPLPPVRPLPPVHPLPPVAPLPPVVPVPPFVPVHPLPPVHPGYPLVPVSAPHWSQCFCTTPHFPYPAPISIYPVHQPYGQPYRPPVVKEIEPTIIETTTECQKKVIVQDNSQHNEVNVVQNENIATNGGSQIVTNNNNIVQETKSVVGVSNVINNHPEILNPIRLSEEIEQPKRVKITNDEIEREIRNEIIRRIYPQSITPNVKFVNVDLNKFTRNCEDEQTLDESLINYELNPNRPRALVRYPLFNRPQADQILVAKRKGYGLTSGGGYYSDPSKTVIYKQPTVLSITGSQLVPSVVPPRFRYVCFPIKEHGVDCPCCCRYLGELNERV